MLVLHVKLQPRRIRLLRGPLYSSLPAGSGSPCSPSINQILCRELWTGRREQMGGRVTRTLSIPSGELGHPSACVLSNMLYTDFESTFHSCVMSYLLNYQVLFKRSVKLYESLVITKSLGDCN